MRTARSIAVLSLALASAATPVQAQWSSQQDARVYPQPNDLGQSDRFGESCALDGDTLVVGASWHDPFGGGTDYGAAYVFVRAGGGWAQQAKLASSSHDEGDRFGAAVAVQGDLAFVGAPYDDNPGAVASGAVYVFERVAGAWTERARLTASDASTFAHFGASLAVHGSTLAIGAEWDGKGGGAFAGSAYVFVKLGSTWTQQAKLVAAGGAANDFMGQSIALSGDRVAVGAPNADQPGRVDAGAVYVFERSGTSWAQVAELSPADAAANDHLGAAVALDGGTLLAGAPHADLVWTNDGAAYVFAGGGASWTLEAKLSDLGPHFSDNFGSAVDLEGDRAVVGLPLSDAAGVTTGGVQLFVRQAGVWSGQFEMVGGDCEGQDYLGVSVAISGDLVAAGAEGGETPPTELPTGEAYVFRIVPPPYVVAYCTGKPNSQGCTPAMGWSGAPSASNPNPFLLTCVDVLSYKYGVLFYGLAPAAVPFQGGTLCVTPPITRTGVQFSGGTPPPLEDCTGTFAFDMNALIQGGADPALVAGAHVFTQYWSRDPAAPFATSLSDAVELRIDP